VTRVVLVGVIASVAFLVAIALLIRSRRLQERFAILWIVTAVGVVVLGLWTDALDLFARAVGIAYPPSALFLLVSTFVVLVLLHAGVVLSRLSEQNQTLAQRVATLDERLRRLENDAAGGDEDEKIVLRAPQSAATARRRLRTARSVRK
jgi:Uncharacterized conserved protein (DUF2304)